MTLSRRVATTDATLVSSDEPVASFAPSDGEPGAPRDAPLDVRSTALLVIAVLASLVALNLARELFLPLVLGLMLSYALTPLVNCMVRLRVPRGLAAAALLIAMLGGIGSTAYSLSGEAVSLIETLPEAAQKLRRGLLLPNPRATGTIDRMQQAATELERATEDGVSSRQAPNRGVSRVQIEKPKFVVRDYLWPGALGLAAAAGQATVIIFVTFFLLASGDTFRRKIVKLAGPTLSRKKLTLQTLDEIDLQIQRYLLVQVSTSSLVGVATWLAFLSIGLESAAVWGVVAFALNFVPYLGSIAVGSASALTAFLQFGSFEMALLVGGVAMSFSGIEGFILTPWLSGRASRMNAVAVFVGVLAWGWLWGLWGLFLGMPILMATKLVCDRIDDFKAVGELLGE